jgi:hypothetical protein
MSINRKNISMLSNIFSVSASLFSAFGILTGMIITLGLRLIGKDIYKFIDNYKTKNFYYHLILFFCLYTLLGGFLGLLTGFLENYFSFISSKNTLSFMNGLLISQLIIMFLRLKGTDLYK